MENAKNENNELLANIGLALAKNWIGSSKTVDWFWHSIGLVLADIGLLLAKIGLLLAKIWICSGTNLDWFWQTLDWFWQTIDFSGKQFGSSNKKWIALAKIGF